MSYETKALNKIATALGGEAKVQKNEILNEIADNAWNLAGAEIHICSSGEYDLETGLPTITDPDDKTFYLVPSEEEESMYREFMWTDGRWELFGTGGGGGLKNLVDGSALGSVRGVGTSEEDSSYSMGNFAFAEGFNTKASGFLSHAEGYATTASGSYAHAEGSNTTSSGNCSHAEGCDTKATHKAQHVFGEYNVADPSTKASSNRGTYVEIVGKGTANNTRSNARTLDWSGNEVLAGKLTVGAAPTADMDVATKKYVDDNAGLYLLEMIPYVYDDGVTDPNTAFVDPNSEEGRPTITEVRNAMNALLTKKHLPYFMSMAGYTYYPMNVVAGPSKYIAIVEDGTDLLMEKFVIKINGTIEVSRYTLTPVTPA